MKTPENRRALRGHYLRTYGITPEEMLDLYIRQEGACAICGGPMDLPGALSGKPRSKLSVCVDHDHKTGAVRGLLDRRCNAGIGLLRESTEIHRRAIAYLEEHE